MLGMPSAMLGGSTRSSAAQIIRLGWLIFCSIALRILPIMAEIAIPIYTAAKTGAFEAVNIILKIGMSSNNGTPGHVPSSSFSILSNSMRSQLSLGNSVCRFQATAFTIHHAQTYAPGRHRIWLRRGHNLEKRQCKNHHQRRRETA